MNLNFTLILQIISFLVLLGFLMKFLYKPLTKYLDERALFMHEAITNAKLSEDKAKVYAEQTHAALNLAKEEALKIKEEARGLSEDERKRVIQGAKKESMFLVEEARAQLAQEKEELVKKLRAEVSRISVEIAKKVLNRELSKKDHSEIIEESLSEIENVFTRT
ncbi:MAG: F0F1 ATP synthase subunit B [Candidatus Omnitrophota bacterium]